MTWLPCQSPGFPEVGIHFRDLSQGPFPGLQDTPVSAAAGSLERTPDFTHQQIVTQVQGQVSTVAFMNHEDETKEAYFPLLHYFFLKSFFFFLTLYW